MGSGGAVDLPDGGYLQWTRVAEAGTAIHLELADGSDYSEPMDPALVSLLTDFGWQAPNDQFRNAWLQVEPGAELRSAAELVARTLVLGLGWDWPRISSQ